MKNDLFENRMNLSNHKNHVPASKLNSGSVQNKFPVILDGGKTIIFIADRSLESETRSRYEIRRK
jgi:hypothetical protein